MLSRFVVAAALAAALAASQAVGAQESSAIPVQRDAFLDANHWSRTAVQKFASMGWIDADLARSAWPLRRSDVRALFRSAAYRTRSNSEQHALTLQLAETFDREFADPEYGPAHLQARIGGGWAGHEGALLGGTTVRGAGGAWRYPGPVAAPAHTGPSANVQADAAWRAIVASAAFISNGSQSLEHAYLAVAAGPFDFWGGRRELDFAQQTSGSLTFSPAHALDGLGMRTARPVHLPLLGDVHGTLFVARMQRSGGVDNPWLSAARVVLTPHSHIAIGMSRAAIFGGNGNVDPSVANVFLMLFGLTSQLGKDSGYENQVASIDVSTHATLAGLPVAVYSELGVDDVGFSMFTTAAFLAGLEIPSVPGMDALSFGIEHARIPHSCCGHPPWYRHGDLGDGWTDRGRLLGHTLGGHGSEWTVSGTLASAPVQMQARLFARERGEENLFSPDRAGSSAGGSLRLSLPIGRHVLLRAAAITEHGRTGWEDWSADLGVRLLLGEFTRARR